MNAKLVHDLTRPLDNPVLLERAARHAKANVKLKVLPVEWNQGLTLGHRLPTLELVARLVAANNQSR